MGVYRGTYTNDYYEEPCGSDGAAPRAFILEVLHVHYSPIASSGIALNKLLLHLQAESGKAKCS